MKPFVHPGTFMSPRMTHSLKADAHSDPLRKKALDRLIRDTPIQHKPMALERVDVSWNGVGKGHMECTKDAEMAVSAAMLLWATEEKQYGTLAIRIINAWANINKIFVGNNAPLEAAWSVCSFARAAELLKYSNMSADWKKIEGQFYTWIDIVIMPVLRDASVWKWGFYNNWHFSILCARMQLAILREDRVEWDWVVQTYRAILPKAFVENGCKGQTVELCRDLTHNMFLLGGMVQLPEMAYHQGVMLYDMRLIDCYETHCRLMMKENAATFGLKQDDIKAPYGYYAEPVFEIAYAHFHDREKKSMPATEKYLAQVRPERVTFHWGGNTLTHYRRT